MKLNHIFWWVAGADCEKMEKCPSDQKRMGAIGMVILLTSFVAFIAGTAAAMFFTQKGGATSGKLGWSLAFGVLWMLIIFVIDRSLVVTMKKDPTREWQFPVVIGPFLFRMVLASIIALMISIPLELYIFDGFIEVQGKRYAAIEANEYANLTMEQQKLNAIDSANARTQGLIDDDRASVKTLGEEISENNRRIEDLSAKLNKPNTQRYNDAVRRIDEKNQERRNEQVALRNARTAADSSRIQGKIKQINGVIAENDRIRKEELKKWNDNLNAQIKVIRGANTQNEAERDRLNGQITQAQNRIAEQDSIRWEVQKTRDADDADFKSRQKNASRFFRDYQILNNTVVEKDEKGLYKYPTELLFFWLIRIIFFLIELLPTLVKVITPVGAYDRLAYDEENASKDFFGSTEYHDAVQELQRKQLQHDSDMQQERLKIDRDTKLEIMKKVSLAQQEVADEALKRWKKQKMNIARPPMPATTSTVASTLTTTPTPTSASSSVVPAPLPEDSTDDEESFISMA